MLVTYDVHRMIFKEEHYIGFDGLRMHMSSWIPDDEKPRALLIAVHGLGSHGYTMKTIGEYFVDRGIAVFAPDMRGFGHYSELKGHVMSFDEYIDSCGGFSFRANDENILIIQRNGKVTTYDAASIFGEDYKIHPGDSILILGKVDTKYLQVVKDITQIVYQLAIGAAVVLRY